MEIYGLIDEWMDPFEALELFSENCTFNASSWLSDPNGVPFTSSIESPGRRPARSASDPSSIRDT